MDVSNLHDVRASRRSAIRQREWGTVAACDLILRLFADDEVERAEVDEGNAAGEKRCDCQ